MQKLSYGKSKVDERIKTPDFNRTPGFNDNTNISQVTISNATPQFFNMQDSNENKVLEASANPFRGKPVKKKELRLHNDLACVQTKSFNEKAKQKDLQFIYWK